MTTAAPIAVIIIAVVVFALGVYVGNQLSRKRRQKIYADGYEQGKFDLYMDYLTGYQEGFGAGEMHHAAEYGEVTR